MVKCLISPDKFFAGPLYYHRTDKSVIVSMAYVIGADFNCEDLSKSVSSPGLFCTITWKADKMLVYGSLVLTYWLS